MGLFSGKTKIHVSSVAYNIAGDAAERSNFLKQNLIFLNSSGQSIGEKLPRMYLQSLGIKMKRAYRHAAALPQGLPTASMQLWEYQDFEEAVQTILDIEKGIGRFVVEDAYLTDTNTAPAIETYLNKTYGWDSVTGKMTKPPAGFSQTADVTWRYEPPQTRYLDGSPQVSRSYVIEFRHSEADVAPDLEVTVSVEAVENFASSMLVAMISERVTSTRSDATVTRAFQTGDTTHVDTSSTTSTVGSKETVTTTTVTMTTDGTTTTIRTRVVDVTKSEKVSREFALGTGEWPTLDTLWNSRANVEQTFFPSIPFRVENKDMMADNLSETEHYKDVVKVCALMGVNADLIRDQINSNPSIKDIDYAFMVAGANMNTESQAEMDYLFRFWEMCMDRQTIGEAQHTAWTALNIAVRKKPGTNSLLIEDPESKNGAYKIRIEWDWVKKVTVDGLMEPDAKVGHYKIVSGATVTHDFTSTENRWLVDSTVVSIRKQISSTQYEELQISGAVHKNDVYKGKCVETLAKDARANPSEHEGFIVPLHMGIFNTMPLTKRTQLGQECLYLVFNCYVKVKQKWYQTGIFKIILAIILIIVIIFTWGTATPAATAVWGAATLAATVGITIAMANLIMSFVIGYLVSYLLGKWSAGFESVFGKKWAGIVMAVVAIAVTAYTGGYQSGSWLKTAVQIMDIASQLFTAYAKGVSLERQDEYDAFMDKAEEDRKKLEQLSTEFFGEGDLVSVDYLLALQKTLREDSPTVFLSRTLMTGSDIVDITLGMVSDMVSLQLQPRLQGIHS